MRPYARRLAIAGEFHRPELRAARRTPRRLELKVAITGSADDINSSAGAPIADCRRCAPRPMTNTAFDDGVERSYKVPPDRTSRLPWPGRIQPTQSSRQIAASRYVGCTPAVATFPIAAVTIAIGKYDRDSTTGP